MRRRSGAPPIPTVATWDSANKDGGINLSSGDLLATNTAGAYQAVLANLSRNAGKHYFQVTLGASSGSPFAMMGVATTRPSGSYIGSIATGWAYYQQTGEKYTNATPTAFGANFNSGDVIGVGYDASTGQIEFFKNGTSQGIAFTITPGTTVFPAFSPFQTNSTGLLAASAADIGTIPGTGYSAWE